MVLLIIAVLVVITVFTIPHIRLENLTGFNLKNIFLPYGVVLFACIGMSAMPEMKEELRNHKHLMKKAIILGTLVPLIIYIIFCLVVVGVTGVENVTDGAILGLGVVLGGTIMKIGLVFGIFTMTISFLSVGLALKDMFYFDFKIKRVQAAILVCLIPIASYIIIYSMKIHNIFYRMLDITGAVLFSLLGIIVIIMSLKATQYGDRKPEYVIQGKTILGVVIIGMFIMGFINEFINLL
jgi:tyrosine-specific transport protein